jgi:hypothetical protein
VLALFQKVSAGTVANILDCGRNLAADSRSVQTPVLPAIASPMRQKSRMSLQYNFASWQIQRNATKSDKTTV